MKRNQAQLYLNVAEVYAPRLGGGTTPWTLCNRGLEHIARRDIRLTIQ